MDQKGFILIVVTIIMAVLLALGGVHLSMISSEQRLTLRSYRRISAINLAEAGIELAIWELNYGNIASWSGSPATKTVTSFSSSGGEIMGDFTVTADLTSDPVIEIEATGYTPSTSSPLMAKRRVKVVTKGRAAAFDYTVCTKELLKVEAPVSITGDLHSNTNIINEGVAVTGAGSAHGAVSGDGTFSEGSQDSADEITLPTLDMVDYATKATEVGYTHNEDWDVTGATLNIPVLSPINGIIYIYGNLEGDGVTIVGPGIIVAEGYIKLESNSVVGSSAATAVGLFSDYDGIDAIKLETDSACYAVLFGPKGQVKIETTSTLYGSIVGETFKLETDSTIEYLDLSGSIDLPFSGGTKIYSVTSWQEK
ncbi:MAG: hypothetical protein KAX20_01170 [Candidatus Omnitrophica bacterium]|nr:hypothetical protein [Candidatus Omnitrophota bacterium]